MNVPDLKISRLISRRFTMFVDRGSSRFSGDQCAASIATRLVSCVFQVDGVGNQKAKARLGCLTLRLGQGACQMTNCQTSEGEWGGGVTNRIQGS